MGDVVSTGPTTPRTSPATTFTRTRPSSVTATRELLGGVALVAGRRHLAGRGEVHPQLHAVDPATTLEQLRGGHLGVEHPGAGRHPLHVPRADHAVVATGVDVLHGAFEQVGHGLEAAVGMGGRTDGLTGRVLRGSHLVEQQEGIEAVVGRQREGPVHAEPTTLEHLDRRHHRADLPRRHRSTSIVRPSLGRFDFNQQVATRGHSRAACPAIRPRAAGRARWS